jgi:hypothetical protein
MQRRGAVLVKAGEVVHPLVLSSRDIHLLDARYFFADGWSYRKLFALDFFSGLKAPPLDTSLVNHKTFLLLEDLRRLLVELETQRDLISLDYSYGFEAEGKRRSSAGQSGFRLEGGFGYIDARPAGSCYLTISLQGPNGRGRVHTIVDMRVRREYPTIDLGMLRVYTRQAAVGWFDELDKLIGFLDGRSDESVEIIHSKM